MIHVSDAHPGPRANILYGDGHVEGKLVGEVTYTDIFPAGYRPAVDTSYLSFLWTK